MLTVLQSKVHKCDKCKVCHVLRFWTVSSSVGTFSSGPFTKEPDHNKATLFFICLAVAAVNQAVKENRAKQTLRVLSLPELELRGVLLDCASDYQRELSTLIADRTRSGDDRSPWVRVQLHDGSFYYFHLNRLEGSWEKPSRFKPLGLFLTQQEIQVRHIWRYA
ncbi:hypothetical protein AMECASPLE_037598 [Ameca splendens]|uniref:WW domain-containing protein n=1 Tax=Ameca splendens TaxID=208324 RepID=A0ABV0Y8A8_9TELE